MAATEVICHVHQHEVCCIAINQQGTRIATCSTKVREREREMGRDKERGKIRKGISLVPRLSVGAWVWG